MAGLLPIALLAAATSPTVSPQPPADTVDCAAELTVDRDMPDRRIVDPEDLLGLIDIGPNAEVEDGPLFAVSPDGNTMGIAVRRAIVSSNSYCSGLYLVSRDGHAQLIDSAPDAIVWRFPNLLGKANFPTGFAKIITPRWTADGTHLAYLKSIAGRSQVWIMNANGSSGHAATASDRDILDFRLSADGATLTFKVDDPGPQQRALDIESRSGIHYDERYSPLASRQPFLRGPLPAAFHSVDLASGRSRSATAVEIDAFQARTGSQTAPVATIEIKDGAEPRIVALGVQPIPCPHAACRNVVGTPWMSGGKHIRYLRREGWGKSETAIYEWTVGGPRPRRLYTTNDLLVDCRDLGADIVCVSEGSVQPRRLVRIDARTGQLTTLFDPNPGFSLLKLGSVRRLHWRNRLGVECFGDLVLPVDYKAGEKYPLLVVQYSSRGFLRGGTGDEFPIQAFAGRGYAVLSVQRPIFPLPESGLTSEERERLALADFQERWHILFTIEDKVRDLIAEGLVDPARVGISGLSEGSTTVQFAAVHSPMFAAGSASGCCWEPSQAWLLGPGIQKLYSTIGWPGVTGDHDQFWSQISLARNASRIRMPLLLQAPDDEFRASLESFTALREAHHPVDLYIFPNEHHVKWEPVHRLSIYQRNLDWFGFWLKDEAPSLAPDHRDEDNRWSALKRQWKSSAKRVAPQ